MITANLFIKFVMISAAIFFGVCSCYHMPGDDEYSIVPTTNNPVVIGRDNQPNLIPGGGF